VKPLYTAVYFGGIQSYCTKTLMKHGLHAQKLAMVMIAEETVYVQRYVALYAVAFDQFSALRAAPRRICHASEVINAVKTHFFTNIVDVDGSQRLLRHPRKNFRYLRRLACKGTQWHLRRSKNSCKTRNNCSKQRSKRSCFEPLMPSAVNMLPATVSSKIHLTFTSAKLDTCTSVVNFSIAARLCNYLGCMKMQISALQSFATKLKNKMSYWASFTARFCRLVFSSLLFGAIGLM